MGERVTCCRLDLLLDGEVQGTAQARRVDGGGSLLAERKIRGWVTLTGEGSGHIDVLSRSCASAGAAIWNAASAEFGGLVTFLQRFEQLEVLT